MEHGAVFVMKFGCVKWSEEVKVSCGFVWNKWRFFFSRNVTKGKDQSQLGKSIYKYICMMSVNVFVVSIESGEGRGWPKVMWLLNASCRCTLWTFGTFTAQWFRLVLFENCARGRNVWPRATNKVLGGPTHDTIYTEMHHLLDKKRRSVGFRQKFLWYIAFIWFRSQWNEIEWCDCCNKM